MQFIKRIKNKIELKICKIHVLFFKFILKRYNIDFYFRDNLGIISKRRLSDNFVNMFRKGDSCDAAPFMHSLDLKLENLGMGIDVGANIGITTVWLARKCKEVYAFEPEDMNITRMKETLRYNCVNNVKLIKSAVSNRMGEGQLKIMEGYGHHSLGEVSTSRKVGEKTVPLITLDKFCEIEGIKMIDVLKIDVEGFEEEVLEGAKNLLQKGAINLIIFEISEIPLRSLGKDPREVCEMLIKYGYDIYYPDMKKFSIEFLDSGYGALDLLAIRKESNIMKEKQYGQDDICGGHFLIF